MGLRNPFRVRTVPCNQVLLCLGKDAGWKKWPAGLSVHGDLMLEMSYPDKRRSENVCDTANADPCQLTWSSKHVFLQNSSSSPNATMTSMTNGSAELHTKHFIFAASGGRISLIFLLWDLQTRGKNSWVCERSLSVCKSNVSTGEVKGHEVWGTNWDAQSSEIPSFAWVYF